MLAYYTMVNFTVTVNYGVNGETAASSVVNTVNSGQSFSFTPNPSTGYKILNVCNATTTYNGIYSVTYVISNVTVYVSFI